MPLLSNPLYKLPFWTVVGGNPLLEIYYKFLKSITPGYYLDVADLGT